MSERQPSPVTLRFLIEQKVAYINTSANICMLWWASSIVFSASVLAAVWSHQAELRKEPFFLGGLGLVLFVFFFVISYFGHLVAVRVGSVQKEIAELAKELHYERLKETRLNVAEGFYYTERRTFQISMWLGAGSFALVWLVWIIFWWSMSGWWTSRFILIGSGLWLVVWFILRRKKKLP